MYELTLPFCLLLSFDVRHPFLMSTSVVLTQPGYTHRHIHSTAETTRQAGIRVISLIQVWHTSYLSQISHSGTTHVISLTQVQHVIPQWVIWHVSHKYLTQVRHVISLTQVLHVIPQWVIWQVSHKYLTQVWHVSYQSLRYNTSYLSEWYDTCHTNISLMYDTCHINHSGTTRHTWVSDMTRVTYLTQCARVV